MRVLITVGSTRGGTQGIAEELAADLVAEGVEVVVRAPAEVEDVRAFDAVVVGGALYAQRWHSDARAFVLRHVEELRSRPVWFFSSGPLDDRASRVTLPPVPQVFALMKKVGARGHVTFGGRLDAEPKGFIAHLLARHHAGDWRDHQQIRRWAHTLGDALLGRAPRPSSPEAVSPYELQVAPSRA
jgi:menaquinone-dependent protoporphyrinogen oxidase